MAAADARPARYGLATRLSHWISALLIIGLGVSGWWMVGLGYYDPWYHRAPDLHKQFGVLALLLAVLRPLWWWIERWPPLPTGVSRAERVLARLMHALLFALCLLVPASGYLMVTAAGDPVTVTGLDLPAIGAGRTGLRDAAIAVHTWGSYALLGLAAAHAAAALKHQFINRDGVLRRIL